MKKKLLIVINFIIFNISVVGVSGSPHITSVSDQILSDNQQNIIIKGTNFNFNNPKNIEFLYDHIEESTPDVIFNKTRWNNHGSKITYTNEDKYSGTKSILFKYDEQSGSSRFTTFDLQKKLYPKQHFYFTTWVKLVKNDNVVKFQWKNNRLLNNDDYNSPYKIYGDPWYFGNGNPAPGPPAWGNPLLAIYVDGITDQSTKSSTPKDAFLFDEWQRLEVIYEVSNIGEYDGNYEWRRIGRKINNNLNDLLISNYNILTYDKNDIEDFYQFFMIGIYYGNLSYDENVAIEDRRRDMKVYYDDVYISNSFVRVEIGNNPVFNQCTLREIQHIHKWPRINVQDMVKIKVNKGGLSSGINYLFVIDNDNIPSQGYPITLQ